MAASRFYTRVKGDKLAPVYICFQHNADKTRYMIKTPYNVFTRYWSDKRQSLKPNLKFIDARDETKAKGTEKTLHDLRDFISTEHGKLTEPASKQWLIDTIDKFRNIKAPKVETLNQYIKRFISEAESGKRLASAGNTKKRYSNGSVRVLRGFMLSFNNFQGIENPGIKPRGKHKKQPYKPLNWDDVNIDTYNDFVQYFYSRNCGANYIGKHIKSFKTIMRAAREDGLHNNMEVERRAFKTISEEVDHIYLTEAELKKLFDWKLSDDLTPLNTGLKPSELSNLPVVRDVFLAGCYTAQRYSDYSRINKSNIRDINRTKYIELIQKKTGEKCIIPIRPELNMILKRYDYTLPKTFEQKVNTGIKIIADKAGITELIHVEKNRGGMKVKSDVKKCDLIKTHTARRTGCSLMYLAGIPILDIMKISGHRTPKEFLKYIRIGKEETAVSLAKHPYFTLKVV